LDYPGDRVEIILARGKHPSVQRNEAVKIALGDWIYFLDDDSIADQRNLHRALQHANDSKVAVIGGPNLCPTNAPKLEQWFALAMGSKLAFGPSAARYRKIGGPRLSSEKELILCNLMFRKKEFESEGAFDCSLYPNEENALMDAIGNKGYKLIYDPEFVAYRNPRPNLKAFLKMLMTYGRGRAEQFRLHPTTGSILNFVPAGFVIFILLLPFLPKIFLWLLPVYLVAVLAQAMVVIPRSRLSWVFPVSALIAASHLFYGVGFWRGLLTRLKKSTPEKAEVTLEHIV
jgi:GT2 family glycosyltransferase